MNRVLTTQRGLVIIVPVAPAVMAATTCKSAVSALECAAINIIPYQCRLRQTPDARRQDQTPNSPPSRDRAHTPSLSFTKSYTVK
jgi:hypothetical protein